MGAFVMIFSFPPEVVILSQDHRRSFSRRYGRDVEKI